MALPADLCQTYFRLARTLNPASGPADVSGVDLFLAEDLTGLPLADQLEAMRLQSSLCSRLYHLLWCQQDKDRARDYQSRHGALVHRIHALEVGMEIHAARELQAQGTR